MATNRDNDPANSSAPPRLIAALCQTQSGRVFVPRSADEAVLRAARERLAPARPRLSSLLARWWCWPAFATACLLLCAVGYRLARTIPSSNPVLVHAREDLNRDGRVDILDAFQLARQLQSGVEQGRDLDFNSDGMVDHSDADALATRAVSLEKGGRS